MRLRKIAFVGFVCAGLYFVVYRSRDPVVSMHEHDWSFGGSDSTRRRYRSPGHFIHHTRELAGLLVQIREVYLLRSLSPAFREKIMIVTAMANDCSP